MTDTPKPPKPDAPATPTRLQDIPGALADDEGDRSSGADPMSAYLPRRSSREVTLISGLLQPPKGPRASKRVIGSLLDVRRPLDTVSSHPPPPPDSPAPPVSNPRVYEPDERRVSGFQAREQGTTYAAPLYVELSSDPDRLASLPAPPRVPEIPEGPLYAEDDVEPPSRDSGVEWFARVPDSVPAPAKTPNPYLPCVRGPSEYWDRTRVEAPDIQKQVAEAYDRAVWRSVSTILLGMAVTLLLAALVFLSAYGLARWISPG